MENVFALGMLVRTVCGGEMVLIHPSPPFPIMLHYFRDWTNASRVAEVAIRQTGQKA